MTKEELASKITGNEYTKEISKQLQNEAKESGLVVVFGASDDLVEFRGAIYDECGAWDGTTVFVNLDGVYPEKHDCDCDFCGHKEILKQAKKLEALWDDGSGYSWTFKTDIPHVTFEIMELGERFCRGIVFSVNDLSHA